MESDRREAARQFFNKWNNRGKEDEDDRSYWIEFLQNILEVDNVTDRIEFQKKVIGPDGNTKRIDAYIPETRVLIEQKSLKIDLSKPQQGHDGMTPYEQAKMYDNSLPVSEKAKWIVLSNFGEIWVYDMDSKKPEPVKFLLSEVPNKYSSFEFLVNKKQQIIHNTEMEISVKAGEFVGLMYDALHKEYINPDSEESLKSLNMLCVRLVFCLYAEDAHIFGSNGHMFHDYMEQFEAKDMRKALIELFKVLDTKIEDRDPYDNSEVSKFPYVNGGLFAKEDIEIPNFTDEIRDILLNKASEGFDWSTISPTIFGACFESSLNPETRRSGGMHYTSIENLHKITDELFLNALKDEYAQISEIKIEKTRKAKLEAFQDKLSKLTFFDPACGSGNFLTETYISLRRLENLVIRDILDCDRKQIDGQIIFGAAINPIKVSISQFYGIEINDFAVTVGKTALWIAESQMMKETEDIISMSLDFLPLKTNANIHEGNALKIDWNEIIPPTELSYIIGNPPFVGARWMNPAQKADVLSIFGSKWKSVGDLDYVSCWYKKAADYMTGTNIKAALVSTNSITQGVSVSNLWRPLFDEGLHIDFAYRTFIWDSEASTKAHVHCVIVGFSKTVSSCEKHIYEGNNKIIAHNINGYLLDADNIFIDKRTKPISDVPVINLGGQALDDGNYILTAEEKTELLRSEPQAASLIKPYMMGKDFIDRKPRYCIWLNKADPSLIKKCPLILKRVENVKEFRQNSKRDNTLKAAAAPTLFGTMLEPQSDYIAIPKVSSQNRRYIPIDYLSKDIIPGDKIFAMQDAGIYHFGVITSNIHMAWTRAICGRLKSDYSYSNTLVYNNFPWPSPTDEQKRKIEETAQGILDARALYPDSSLADLYDPLTMPIELQKAHTANDRAVMQAYGFDIKTTTEADCVAKLMQMYKELTDEKSS
ncbi:MAG: methylase [Butyrivibrio sp.]|uniref:DNA methyltransferase n=1 Tax=Butyrivibrio sp. TaxID=28121 RepID=UPI001B6A7C11|nr:DNA methyltransferase [Butyrivibrio sp.]MBP3784456.1 methylase [Butyrivibrio sp.]